jgi:glycosyltransferase involved in cell wall biosynthesis
MKSNFDKQLSIIVCCYSGEETIEACLISLKNLRVDGITVEVILIDDGSRDDTSNLISSYLEQNPDQINPSFKYYRKINEGLSVARNYGVNKSHYNLVAFIDEDSVPDTLFAIKIIETFKNSPDINCVGGSIDLLNTENKFSYLLHNYILEPQMGNNNFVIGTNMAFRKDIIYHVGGFQPEFTYRGDETAFIAKAGTSLKIMNNSMIRVKHSQPTSLSNWLQTRYENGFFAAGITKLINHNFKKSKNRLSINILATILMCILIVSLFISSNVSLFISILLLFPLIYRLLLKGSIFTNANNYARKSKKVNLYMYIYIIYIELWGKIFEETGYTRGYWNYRNTIYDENIQL